MKRAGPSGRKGSTGPEADAIVYMSVTDESCERVAVFLPLLLSNCRRERHFCHVWDGKTISTIYEKRTFA